MFTKIFKTILFTAVISFILSACGTTLNSANLSTGVVNEPYSFQLTAESHDWELWNNDGFVYTQSGGILPAGMYVEANGKISGTPSEVGNFDFRVTVYEFDQAHFFGIFFYDPYYDDHYTWDSEWFTLYVTEDSTNVDCPAAKNETTVETFICLGDPEVETLAQDESFDLDVNYFVNFDQAQDYAINSLDFTIHYDADLFDIDQNLLNSQLLREAATRVTSTADYDNSIAGELRVTITSGNGILDRSGRIINIPFLALVNIAAGNYDFALTINAITSETDSSLPTAIELDGSLSVEDDIGVEIDPTI